MQRRSRTVSPCRGARHSEAARSGHSPTRQSAPLDAAQKPHAPGPSHGGSEGRIHHPKLRDHPIQNESVQPGLGIRPSSDQQKHTGRCPDKPRSDVNRCGPLMYTHRTATCRREPRRRPPVPIALHRKAPRAIRCNARNHFLHIGIPRRINRIMSI